VDIPPHHRGRNRSRHWEFYALTFDDKDLKFVVSEEQYRTLAENIVYRVFYDPSKPDKILSID